MSGSIATSPRLRALFELLRDQPGWHANGALIRAMTAAGHPPAALHSAVADLRADPAVTRHFCVPPAVIVDGTYYYCCHRRRHKPPPKPQSKKRPKPQPQRTDV